MKLPSALIFVNSDLNDISRSKIETQLLIHQTMTKAEFDYLVSNDPSYIDQVNVNDLRILVIGDFYQDFINRTLFDLIIFYSHGLVNIEYNKFGPPIPALTLENLDIFALLRAGKSNKVITLPDLCNHCNTRKCDCQPCNCGAPFYHPYDPSGVYCSSESHYTNEAWLNRDK